MAQSDGTATEYFTADGLGSVRQLTDSTGSALLNQTFDPYGNPYVRTGAGDTRFGFTGEQVDGNGLVYLRARYYQPEMGRFLSADPSRVERNPYQYAMSNPVLHTDPSGLQAESPCAEFDWLCQIMFMLTASIVSAPPTVGDPLTYSPYPGDPYLLPEIYPSIRSPNMSPNPTSYVRTLPLPWRFLRNCGLVLLFLDVLTWCGSTPMGCGHPELDAQNLPTPWLDPQRQYPIDPAPPRDRDDDEPNWVVRAGLAKSVHLIEGYDIHASVKGLYGLSVQSQPGVPLQLLASVGFPNAQVSYAKKRELAQAAALLGYALTITKSPGHGSYHSTLSVWKHGKILMDLPPDAAEALSAAFWRKMPNPNRITRR